MPRDFGLPPGTLALLVLRLLDAQPLHGYAIAQRIRLLSQDALSVEEGSLYPALQRLLQNGWVKAAWTTSESGREVREYRLTASGRKQLSEALSDYRRTSQAIGLVLDNA
jgi:transcriptional regulator